MGKREYLSIRMKGQDKFLPPRPPKANLYTHLFINMVQKELNFKNYNKDWRLSSAFDRHSPAKRDEVGELVHLAGDSVPRSATKNNI
jgi:hypothetical protein